MRGAVVLLLSSAAVLRAAGSELPVVEVRELKGPGPSISGTPVEPGSLSLVRRRMKELGIPYPTVIAHRGASAYAPQGTEPALICAAAMGADYIEMDVQLTRDGILVVQHDDNFQWNTDIARIPELRRKAGALVGEFDWSELRGLDASAGFKGQPGRCWDGSPTRLATLQDALRAVRSVPGRSPGVYLEAKYPTSRPELAPKIAEAIVLALEEEKWPLNGRKVIFETFSWDALRRFKRLAPKVPVAFLYSTWRSGRAWEELLNQTRDSGADIIGPKLKSATGDFIEEAHRRGLIVHPWTVNVPATLRALLDAGVDGYFTDQPDLDRAR